MSLPADSLAVFCRAAHLVRWVSCFALSFLTLNLQAQWRTQELDLKPGWNGVYLHVDASHTDIDTFLQGLSGSESGVIDAAEIEQIWCWAASITDQQFMTSADQSLNTTSNWIVWEAGQGDDENLKSFIGNSAFLIKVADAGAGGILPVVGKPVPPVYRWNTNGVNFIGFSTLEDGNLDFPSFDTFFQAAPPSMAAATIFYYDGGSTSTDLVETTGNSSTQVERGKAYWVSAANGFYNRYFGTFKLTLQDLSGMHFGSKLSQYRLKIENLTASELTVSWDWFSDGSSPDVGDEIALEQDLTQNPAPAEILIRRDSFDTGTLTFPVTDTMAGSVTLGPAEGGDDSIEIVFGVDRSQMSGSNPYTGILAFSDDTNGFYQVEIPVTAEVDSTAGLWVGEVALDSVSERLDYFLTETVNGEEEILYDDQGDAILDPNHYEFVVVNDEAEILYLDGQPLRAHYTEDPIADGVIDETPSYDLSFYETEEDAGTGETVAKLETITPDPLSDGSQSEVRVPILSDTATSVAKPYNIRVIVHVDSSGSANLLQRVYYGFVTKIINGEEEIDDILATAESSLDPSYLSASRRISSVHFPYTESNTPWSLGSSFGVGAISTDEIVVAYNDYETNPFIHAYHPDHNNLDSDFDVTDQEAIGNESYGIERSVTFSFASPSTDFDSLTSSSSSVGGTYFETLTLVGKDFGSGSHEVSYSFSGPFVLNQIVDIDTLVLANE